MQGVVQQVIGAVQTNAQEIAGLKDLLGGQQQPQAASPMEAEAAAEQAAAEQAAAEQAMPMVQ
jgi:hypothetical protein